MKLTFIGTRGYVDAHSPLHARHSSLLVSYYGRRVMIDAGEDWLDHLDDVAPDAIILTHAHPDHAFGLRRGAPCPVYAPEDTWKSIQEYPIHSRCIVAPYDPVEVEGVTFEAFPVEHSTVAPAVGYRVSAGRVSIFYSPDVVYVNDRAAALQGVDLYVGDGATLTRPLIRKSGEALVGHAAVRTQLTWCRKEGVSRAVFTHCGTPVVTGDPDVLAAEVHRLGAERAVEATIAHDGMEIVLR